METVDFTIFCKTAIDMDMDVADIRSRVLSINRKLKSMRTNDRRAAADAAACSAVYVIRDMTDALQKFRMNNSVMAVIGALEVLAAVLPKLERLRDIGGYFIGLAACVFQHFSIGRAHALDKVLDDVVMESREFLTDPELLSVTVEVQGELSHQMVFLSALVPGSVCEEEAPALCANIPATNNWEAMHILEDRIKEYFIPSMWRTDAVNVCLTYVRLYAHLMTLRLIVLCRMYDVMFRCDGLGSVAAGYLGAMRSVLAMAHHVLGFFKTGEFYPVTSCVGPVEWPAVYALLSLLGDDHSQCGDWVYNDPGPPDTALSVGKSRLGGEDYYIGRTEFRDELVVGKIYGRKMYWSSEGVEYTTTNLREYEILCITDRKVHAVWRINTPRDPEQLGAYRAGRAPDGGVYYIGRMHYLGQVAVGKVVGGTFTFPYNGNEIMEDNTELYEVLCLQSR